MLIKNLWGFLREKFNTHPLISASENSEKAFEEIFRAAVREAINSPRVSVKRTYEGGPIPNEAKELAYDLDKKLTEVKPVDILKDQNLRKYLTEYLRRQQLVAKGHDQLFIHLPGNPEHELTQVILDFVNLYENDYKYSNLP